MTGLGVGVTRDGERFRRHLGETGVGEGWRHSWC